MRTLLVLLLFPLFSFGQFFKYSTIYTSMTMGTSMIERENYIAVDRGYKDVTEINSMIINGESGLVLLKLVELIGEDQVENLDLESVSFIVGIMNELKTINLRNQMLLKVLPLKV